MFKSMEEPADVQESFLRSADEIASRTERLPIEITPDSHTLQTHSPYFRRSRRDGRPKRLVSNLNRALAIVETEARSLSADSLTVLDAALSGFLAEARLRHAGSGGSSSPARSGVRVVTTSTPPRSIKTLSGDEAKARAIARALQRNSDKGGKKNG